MNTQFKKSRNQKNIFKEDHLSFHKIVSKVDGVVSKNPCLYLKNEYLFYMNEEKFVSINVITEEKHQGVIQQTLPMAFLGLGGKTYAVFYQLTGGVQFRKMNKIQQIQYQISEIQIEPSDVELFLSSETWITSHVFCIAIKNNFIIIDVLDKQVYKYENLFQLTPQEKQLSIFFSHLIQGQLFFLISTSERIFIKILNLPQIHILEDQDQEGKIVDKLLFSHPKHFSKIKRQYFMVNKHHKSLKVYDFMSFQQICQINFTESQGARIQIKKDGLSQFFLVRVFGFGKEKENNENIKAQKCYILGVNIDEYYKKNFDNQMVELKKPEFFNILIELPLNFEYVYTGIVSLLGCQVNQGDLLIKISNLNDKGQISFANYLLDLEKQRKNNICQSYSQEWEANQQWFRIIRSFFQISNQSYDFAEDQLFDGASNLQKNSQFDTKMRSLQFLSRRFDDMLKSFHLQLFRKTSEKGILFQNQTDQHEFIKNEWRVFLQSYLANEQLDEDIYNFFEAQIQKRTFLFKNIADRQFRQKNKNNQPQKNQYYLRANRQQKAQFQSQSIQPRVKQIETKALSRLDEAMLIQTKKIQKQIQQKRKNQTIPKNTLTQEQVKKQDQQYYKFVEQFMHQMLTKQTSLQVQKHSQREKITSQKQQYKKLLEKLKSKGLLGPLNLNFWEIFFTIKNNSLSIEQFQIKMQQEKLTPGEEQCLRKSMFECKFQQALRNNKVLTEIQIFKILGKNEYSSSQNKQVISGQKQQQQNEQKIKQYDDLKLKEERKKLSQKIMRMNQEADRQKAQRLQNQMVKHKQLESLKNSGFQSAQPNLQKQTSLNVETTNNNKSQKKKKKKKKKHKKQLKQEDKCVQFLQSPNHLGRKSPQNAKQVKQKQKKTPYEVKNQDKKKNKALKRQQEPKPIQKPVQKMLDVENYLDFSSQIPERQNNLLQRSQLFFPEQVVDKKRLLMGDQFVQFMYNTYQGLKGKWLPKEKIIQEVRKKDLGFLESKIKKLCRMEEQLRFEQRQSRKIREEITKSFQSQKNKKKYNQYCLMQTQELFDNIEECIPTKQSPKVPESFNKIAEQTQIQQKQNKSITPNKVNKVSLSQRSQQKRSKSQFQQKAKIQEQNNTYQETLLCQPHCRNKKTSYCMRQQEKYSTQLYQQDSFISENRLQITSMVAKKVKKAVQPIQAGLGGLLGRLDSLHNECSKQISKLQQFSQMTSPETLESYVKQYFSKMVMNVTDTINDEYQKFEETITQLQLSSHLRQHQIVQSFQDSVKHEVKHRIDIFAQQHKKINILNSIIRRQYFGEKRQRNQEPNDANIESFFGERTALWSLQMEKLQNLLHKQKSENSSQVFEFKNQSEHMTKSQNDS